MATLAEQIDQSQANPVGAIHAFKQILVHVDREARSDRRIETAIEIAKRFGGKVSGAYVAPPILPMAVAAAGLPPEIFTEQAELDQKDADSAKRRYLDHIARAGLAGEWHYIREAGVQTLRRIARYMDLVIVGQTDPAAPEELVAARPEELALGSGRPVLVVPYIGGALSPGKRIVVAWDASREAARAVSDALPLLRQAQSVWVVSIDAKGKGVREGSTPSDDLCRFLADHAIAAKADRASDG